VKVASKDEDKEERLDSLGDLINGNVNSPDSCGAVSADIRALFLGEQNELYRIMSKDHTDENRFDKTSFLDKIIYPCLVILDLTREVEKKGSEEVSRHSYCLFVLPPKTTRSPLTCYVYQGYYGSYELGRWLEDVKSKKEWKLKEYADKLHDLIEEKDESIRSTVNNELHALTGKDLGGSIFSNIYFKIAPVDLGILSELLNVEDQRCTETINHITTCDPDRSFEEKGNYYLMAIVWREIIKHDCFQHGRNKKVLKEIKTAIFEKALGGIPHNIPTILDQDNLSDPSSSSSSTYSSSSSSTSNPGTHSSSSSSSGLSNSRNAIN
jgi:hypothetical protein